MKKRQLRYQNLVAFAFINYSVNYHTLHSSPISVKGSSQNVGYIYRFARSVMVYVKGQRVNRTNYAVFRILRLLVSDPVHNGGECYIFRDEGRVNFCPYFRSYIRIVCKNAVNRLVCFFAHLNTLNWFFICSILFVACRSMYAKTLGVASCNAGSIMSFLKLSAPLYVRFAIQA